MVSVFISSDILQRPHITISILKVLLALLLYFYIICKFYVIRKVLHQCSSLYTLIFSYDYILYLGTHYKPNNTMKCFKKNQLMGLP